LVLQSGSAAEIYRAIETLRAQPDLARRIGEAGRAFALRELKWPASVDAVQALYAEVEGSTAPPRWELKLEPLVKVIALVSEQPTAEEQRLARRYGIYGFRLSGDGNSPGDAVVFGGDYETALRRRVLQALGRADAQEPLVVVDPRGSFSRAAWLRATRAAVRDGIRAYYASRRLDLKPRAVEDMLRLEPW
jgi:hypothetical protein